MRYTVEVPVSPEQLARTLTKKIVARQKSADEIYKMLTGPSGVHLLSGENGLCEIARHARSFGVRSVFTDGVWDTLESLVVTPHGNRSSVVIEVQGHESHRIADATLPSVGQLVLWLVSIWGNGLERRGRPLSATANEQGARELIYDTTRRLPLILEVVSPYGKLPRFGRKITMRHPGWVYHRQVYSEDGLFEGLRPSLNATAGTVHVLLPGFSERKPDRKLLSFSTLVGQEIDDIADDLEESLCLWALNRKDEGVGWPELLLDIGQQNTSEDVVRLEEEIHATRRELDRLRTQVQQNREPENCDRAAVTFCAFTDGLKALQEQYGDRFVWAPNTRSTLPPQYEDPEVILAVIEWLATRYQPARSGELTITDLPKDLQAQTGVEYRGHNHPDLVTRHPSWYQATWGGKSYPLREHAGKGVSRDPRRTFRIAWAWDPDVERVVVGFIGQHQRTDSG